MRMRYHSCIPRASPLYIQHMVSVCCIIAIALPFPPVRWQFAKMLAYKRMPIEEESPEEIGYGHIRYNLAESSMPDRKLGDLPVVISPDLVLQYVDHRGDPKLRKLLADEAGLGVDDVLITHGAVAALFIHTALLKAGDRLLVVRPNYATNLETPRAIGAHVDYFDLTHETRYAFDVDAFISRITPSTKLISVTTPHNPSGGLISIVELSRIVDAMKASAHPDCLLLVDETYREMVVDGDRVDAWACTLDPRVLSVCSMSKTYGLPGIRIGCVPSCTPMTGL